MSIDRAAADALLTTTRAVRRRLDVSKPVPRGLISECVAIAQQAPTGGNRQGWCWLLVDDPAKRKIVGEICRDAADTMQMFADAAAARGEEQNVRIYNDARALALRLHEIPVLVLPCLTEPCRPGGEAPYYASIYPTVWSFQLAARARGLGSVLTTFHMRHEAELAAALGAPEGVTPHALLPLAFTIGEDFKPAKRPPPETIMHWNGW